MSVSYEEAREIVRARFEPGWTHGTFCLDDRYIAENDEFYVFSVGARENIVDGDMSYAIFGGVPIVYKDDGRIGSRASVDVATDPTIQDRPNPNPTLTV
jgi:5-formaminoimidazole-4-carboxamide-1-beta-D-ribofuranosyl 5'-monophosphate synthetase